MWALIVCVAVSWGGCQEQRPVYYPSKYFCEQAAAKERVVTVYCKEIS